MGHERVTVKNLRVVKVDNEENLVIGVRGGARSKGLLPADPQGQEGEVARRSKDRIIMAVVDVRNLEGKTVGQMELADAVFAAGVNPHLLHETVSWYLAGQRAGTHKTKGRGEVSGSGRKLWKQKGTGRARIGSIRSPLWRKGGTVHGPQPRTYSYRLPRKMVVGALRSALSAKLADEKLTVVDGWTLGSHKTKDFRQAHTRLDDKARTILVVDAAGNRNLELASRNLEGVKLVAPSSLQPYDLLRHGHIMLSKDAATHLGRSLGTGSREESAQEVSERRLTRLRPRRQQSKPRRLRQPRPSHRRGAGRRPRPRPRKPGSRARRASRRQSPKRPRGKSRRWVPTSTK